MTDKYTTFLDKLRASGKVNMYAAGAELERKYGLDREQARAILLRWMDLRSFVTPPKARRKG